MSRRSRSDAWAQLWIKFGDKKPTEQELYQLHMALRACVESAGLTLYSSDFVAKDHKVTDYRGHPQ